MQPGKAWLVWQMYQMVMFDITIWFCVSSLEIRSVLTTATCLRSSVAYDIALSRHTLYIKLLYIWFTSDYTVYPRRHFSHPHWKGLQLKNISISKTDVWLLGGKLWASPKNKRKIKLRFPKKQNITNTEQTRMWCCFVKASPPAPEYSGECANSTSPMLLEQHNFAKVWGLGCGEFCCHSKYQWIRGWGGVVCNTSLEDDFCPMCMVSLHYLLRMNIVVYY